MAYNYYAPAITNTEIDLRTEFGNLMHGDENFPDMIPHGAWVILRKLQRDSAGKPLKGWEVDQVTDEPDMVYKSNNVTETGFLFTDHLVRGFFLEIRLSSLTEMATKAAVINDNLRVLYLEQSAKPELHDVVLQPQVDDSGEVITPVVTLFKWYISNVLPAISDNGRAEFYRCILEVQR